MHSKQFTSFDEAITYMKERGKLKFFGRVGENHRDALYTLTIRNKVYHILLSNDGHLRVIHDRYKHKDE